MCGICGYIGSREPNLLPAMLRTLEHRGPDDEGSITFRVEQGTSVVGLGHTRLSIIDLSAAGHEPMANEDGTVWLVFNGEIYNFPELRKLLEYKGHQFRSHTDAEVILHLYEEEGEACVQKLRGMFAFAIWDQGRQRLLLARDRLGEKPLYYCTHGESLGFASELKALLPLPWVQREVDPAALLAYLTCGYVPQPLSIFQGIRKLPPAHLLVWEKGNCTVKRYWSPHTIQIVPPPTPSTMHEQLRALLQEAVKLRLISDVPLGVFLSGGIDSSAVVAMMRAVGNGPIATFSIGYSNRFRSYNELEYSRLVARHFGTDHHEYIVEPQVQDLLPDLVYHFDEPFADSSAIPTYLVSREARREVTVALSGIGGDELFAGYPRHLGMRFSLVYEHLPYFWRRLLASSLSPYLPDSLTSRSLGNWARRFLEGGTVPPQARYQGWTAFFAPPLLAKLCVPEFWQERILSRTDQPAEGPLASLWAKDPLAATLLTDLTTYLPDDLLAMGDRMSMAHGLELRPPFCDHRLVEWTLSLSPTLRLKGWRPKALLKKALRGILPEAVLRHRKQGFMIPLGQWLQGELRPLMEELLSEAVVKKRGLFHWQTIAWLKEQHVSGKRNFADQLWALMILEAWWQRYLTAEGGG
ncbi:MAG: asparagine synthase (glutamine-hydrolyzing) [Deltaproteobacteria bacterium]|nr:asparagine synthase (glutamine-hydrolyzing) [Deltaproteobacteria bacterium]